MSSEIDFPKKAECWLSTPTERSSEFLPAFVRISMAIQSFLRERLPAQYFGQYESFRDVKTAYPMLVYQASRPFRGRMRTDLTYDVLNPQTLASLFRSVKPVFEGLLERVEGRLQAEGFAELAAQYNPKRATAIIQSVQRLSKSRKCLYILIRAETVLVNALIELAGLGEYSAREQAKRWASVKKKWIFQLRRTYPGTDFLWLAPALLDTASEALLSFQVPDVAPDVSASLSID
jgi:hypothetical protein